MDRRADKQGHQIQCGMPSWPRSRARQPAASSQPHRGGQVPGHRSRGWAAMPAHPHTGPGAEGGGGWPMHATAQPWHAEGRPSPTGALRRLTFPRGRANATACKRCKRKLGADLSATRMVLTPTCLPTVMRESGAEPQTPLFSCTFSCSQKKGFPASPRTLAITNRGDRIRTCDLVLPKHPRYQAAPRPATWAP